jgi:hypothetical protein
MLKYPGVGWQVESWNKLWLKTKSVCGGQTFGSIFFAASKRIFRNGITWEQKK